MNHREQLDHGLKALEDKAPAIRQAASYLDGSQQAAFLSKTSREALDNRLSRLGVNFPRLIVSSRVERLRLTGFTRNGEPDPKLWQRFRRAGLVQLVDLVHADYIGLGSAYVTIWPGKRAGKTTPIATADNGLTLHVHADPATGEPLYAVRRWASTTPAGAESTHAVVIDAERVTTYRTDVPDAYGSNSWKVESTVDNPLELLPVVPFIHRRSASDVFGSSAISDVFDLTDAHAKVLADAMVGSEYFARPRRWATGLEIEEDEDGNAIDPFGERRLLQSESPETKFGQLDGSRADGYIDLLASIAQSIGALSGLPGHYLGLHGDQPPNADSLRAAEAQLVAAAYADHRQLEPAHAAVVAMLHAMDDPDGEPIDPFDIQPVWGSPEARTPAQSADAAAKLHGIGMPLRSLLSDPLGFTPTEIEGIMTAQRSDLVQRAGLDLTKVLP